MTQSGRVIRCTTCGENVRVHEIPVEFIDPALYVCGLCLAPVDQPELHPEREETRTYDPAIAAVPF